MLVVFVPFAFTPVCSGELDDLVQAGPRWRSRGVDVVLISCDAMPTLRAWAQEHAVGFEVLSDFWPHGQTCRTYGAFSQVDGAADRVSVLIDAAGVVRWTTRAARGKARPVSDYESAIDALTQGAPSSDAVVDSAEAVLPGRDGPGR